MKRDVWGHHTRWLTVLLAVGIPVGVITLLIWLALTIGGGLVGLAADSDGTSTVTVFKGVLVSAALSGVLAAAGTEFLKRLLRLQTWFNREAVRGFLGPLADFDWTVRQPVSELILLRPVPPTYSAPLSQVCAQLAHTTSLLASGLSTQSSGDRYWLFPGWFDETEPTSSIEDLQEAAANVVLGSGGEDFLAQQLKESGTPTRGRTTNQSQLEFVADSLSRQAERRLDAFQLQTRARWRLILQWISASLAGGFMLCVGLAQNLAGDAVVVGSVLGMVIGGPVSWAVRDVVRFIETKAT